VLFAAGILYGFAYDTEYAMVDRDDDLKVGIHTSAITLGRHDVTAVMASYAGMLALLAWLGAARGFAWPYWAGLAAAGALAAWHYPMIRGRTREGCFRAFRHANWIGLAVFAGIVLSFELQYWQ
jgi:4-hydroxybenzoate polyprenyltransferase